VMGAEEIELGLSLLSSSAHQRSQHLGGLSEDLPVDRQCGEMGYVEDLSFEKGSKKRSLRTFCIWRDIQRYNTESFVIKISSVDCYLS
jgi:hypothetical protein